MNHLSQHFVNQIWELYHKVVIQAARLDRNYPTSFQRYSAHNLKAFLAYKNNITSELLTALRLRGLQLSSIQHMIHSLQIICSNMGILPPFQFSYSEDPQTILKKRVADIFGHKINRDSPHVMLTLDANMISSSIIEQFLLHGMSIARINCAYDNESTWEKIIQSVRDAENQLRRKGQYDQQSCKIYMDLAGPKIRIASINKTAQPSIKAVRVQVKKSDRLRIYLKNKCEGDYASETEPASVCVNLPEAFSYVQTGHSVYIDDGKIHGIVKGLNSDFVDVEIIAPNTPISLKENKGVNLPDSHVSSAVPALTKKDVNDLAFICRHADIAGLSFVNRPNDLRTLKQLLISYGKAGFPIIAKIETKEAIHNFSSLLLEGLTFSNFGVMVARGDLAIEIGFQQLSIVQEEILPMCHAAHTPVILATQILDTLAKKGIPSRPEMADLSLGSEFDCLMLNKGPFMKETVKFVTETLFLISQVKDFKKSVTRPPDSLDMRIF